LFDVAVIGGGIVGLATARELMHKRPGAKLVLLEKEAELATHQTGHNSGVIHSGIYYRPGSLKASLCRRGVEKLLRFCDENEVPYELCGKLIVATTEEERARLPELMERGVANGVPGLELVSREELVQLEPHAAGIEAIHSPQTGIVSFRAVSEKLGESLERAGAEIRTSTEVEQILEAHGKVRVDTNQGVVEAGFVVNAAGLQADRLAGSRGSVLIVPFRGEYYRLKPERRHLVRNLIYPVPDPRFPFLGVHFTRRIGGEIEAGPNAVLALAREGYRRSTISLADLGEMAQFRGFWKMVRRYWKVGLSEYHRSLRKAVFVRTLQKLVPEVVAEDLEEGGSGVRAMALDTDGTLVDDFRILRNGKILHVLSAPSPAATSALAIAEYIVSGG
jgi:L-2-hydroxyglutarate oxidase